MKKRWRWTIAAVVLVPALLLVAWFVVVPRSYGFRLRQTSRIDMRHFGPGPEWTKTLTSDPAVVADIVGRMDLRPKKHCACAFNEEFIFRSSGGDVRVFMSDHTLIIGGRGEYEMPAGLYERMVSLRKSAGVIAPDRDTPSSP